MPIVQIHMLEGRSDEKKEALIAAVTQAIHETIDAPLDAIRIIIDEMPLQHYGIAGVSAKVSRAKK
ncbi:MAG: 4-oxalocrotonate tautomerase family protein [Firmicutes bacterium]|nr:4-oxalocrotonate tautomerase family protein [Bacillota bacterium]MBR2783172.1 4-oxalocrotonate tautomerase family protein [Bacillota bacterium]